MGGRKKKPLLFGGILYLFTKNKLTSHPEETTNSMKRQLLMNFLKIVLPVFKGKKTTEETNPLQKKSGYEALDEWVDAVMKLHEAQDTCFGYPCNQDIHLMSFYAWFVGSGLQELTLNNAGDPFSDEPAFVMSTQKFEREVMEWFAPYYDFEPDKYWGLVTMSGTDGNSHGIYFGTTSLKRKTGKLPVVYVSDEAHYSNYRLTYLQNLDVRLVKTGVDGCMIPEELEKVLDPSRPCLMVYAMGSTFKGAVDNQKALNAVLEKYPEMEVYRHVDAALFGGYLPFTEYREMVSHKELGYDSISISGHKFFSINSPSGLFFCTREVYDNQQDISVPYLNNNMRMINCSRSGIDPLKFWWFIQKIGHQGWSKEANTILERSDYLEAELKRIGWFVLRNQLSNTVVLKRPSERICKKYMLATGYDEKLGGNLAHVVVMQHVRRKYLAQFIEELQQESGEK